MRFKSIAILIAALATAIMALAPAAQARTPAKGYERFAGCPSPAESKAIALCERVVIDGGHFKMGSKDVPIVNPMTLSGG
jgi:hypothetical protein